jgi:hypothetical protein
MQATGPAGPARPLRLAARHILTTVENFTTASYMACLTIVGQPRPLKRRTHDPAHRKSLDLSSSLSTARSVFAAVFHI